MCSSQGAPSSPASWFHIVQCERPIWLAPSASRTTRAEQVRYLHLSLVHPGVARLHLGMTWRHGAPWIVVSNPGIAMHRLPCMRPLALARTQQAVPKIIHMSACSRLWCDVSVRRGQSSIFAMPASAAPLMALHGACSSQSQPCAPRSHVT